MFSASTTGDNEHPTKALTYYRAVLIVLAAVCVVLQAAGLGPLRNSFWGFHLYAFLPAAALVVAWALLAASAVMLFTRLNIETPGGGGRIVGNGPAWAGLLGLTLVSVLLFWALRSQQSLLGDSLPLMIDLPGGQDFHPRQPLTMWLQQALYKKMGGAFAADAVAPQEIAFKTTAVGSVLAGLIFVPAVYGLGRVIAGGASGRAAPWLVTGILLVQGYSVLFYGYVENYTYYTLFVTLYLLSALCYLGGRVPLSVVSLVLVAGTGLHLSAVGLVPSFLFLAVWGAYKKETRADAAAGIVTGVFGFVFLSWLLGKMSPGFDLWRGVTEMTRVARTSQGGGSGLEYVFGWTHLRDFFNEQFLIGPMGAFVFIPAVVFALAKRHPVTPQAFFLTLAGGVFLAGSWAMSEPLLGYARDWDLFAPAGVCYCAAGLYFLIRHAAAPRFVNQLLLFGLVFSLVQFVPWVWSNHSEDVALARFKTLPLGHGRTEVAVGNWYMRNQNYLEAEKWFGLALEVNPRNANANSMMGRIYARQEKFEIAGRYFERAVMLRPDKVRFREYYVRALLELSLCDEALPHLLWLSERMPENVNFWHHHGDMLLRLGCKEVLAKAYERVIRFAQERILKNPDDDRAYIDAGIFLGRLERYEEALATFERALALNPESAAALFNTANTLTLLGRDGEAVPLYQKFLALYPDHELAGHIRTHLSQ